jgi:hypothetical protein
MVHQPGIFNETCAAFWRSTEAAAAARASGVVARLPDSPPR